MCSSDLTSDRVARGGAGALHPWQLGSAEWTLLLPYRRMRLTSDPIDGQHAVRLALDVPGVERASAAPTVLEEELVPTDPARSTRALLGDLTSNDPTRRRAAIDTIARMASSAIWSAQWAHLVDPLMAALSSADDSDAPLVSRALGALAVGDPATFSATEIGRAHV